MPVNCNQCHKCKNVRPVPGDCHVSCSKPDPDMTVDLHGWANGWAFYPIVYDPIWLTKVCCNFEPKEANKSEEISTLPLD